MSVSRHAIVLFNLGGPDSLEAVEPFLFNLFYDPAIITLPNPLRWLVAKLISRRRTPEAQHIYQQMGGKSPLLENTQSQATVLETALASYGNYKVFTAMRYWHPQVPMVIETIKSYQPDHITLLPLYPQFSTTTTGSFLKLWGQEAKRKGLSIPTTSICCYPTADLFIAAHVELIQAVTQTLSSPTYRLLFSAHGLPERTVKAGDPYQRQIEQSAEAIVKGLNIKELDWAICYQSRVGPLQWIGPSTESELNRAIQDKKGIILVPISFVSEHSETLVELDIQYRSMAEAGGISFYRVPTLGTSMSYIQNLVDLCTQTGAYRRKTKPCQPNHTQCSAPCKSF